MQYADKQNLKNEIGRIKVRLDDTKDFMEIRDRGPVPESVLLVIPMIKDVVEILDKVLDGE